MALGRITGPLLKANLLRQGVNLAFETDLLYIDVINGRIGVKTTTPTNELQINGTARTTNLEVSQEATIASFTISGNTIASTNNVINLTPSGTNPVVYQGKIQTGNLQLSTNVIETLGSNTDLVIETSGTGKVNVNANMLVNGDLHATGTITADGDITIGDSNTDNIVFNADINSNIIPDDNNTWDLGSGPLGSGQSWRTVYSNNVVTDTLTATNIIGNGIELTLPQGNIWYVAENGNDTYNGNHENAPFATIKHALSVATAGDEVFVFPGVFTEIFPLTMPVGVTLRGAGIRATKIQPTVGTIDKDAILLNGQTTVEDLSITGFRYNAINDTGYAFRFVTGMVTASRSPYVRNVTVITTGSTTSPSDPYGYDAGDAGQGAYLDGSVVNPTSIEVACLFHSVTFIVPGQSAVKATNGTRIEWLNSFSYFANKGIHLISGSTGKSGTGKTILRIDNRVGTWAVGNTVTYYDTDGTTVLASGTISSIDGNYVSLTGKCIGFETLTDRLGKPVAVAGNAKLSIVQKKFGVSSLSLDGSGDYISLTSQPDFNFGTDDFTIEGWFYPTASGTYRTLFDLRTATPTDGGGIIIGINNLDQLYFYYNFGFRIGAAGSVPLNQWSHIALSRVSGVTRAYVNGAQIGADYVDTNNYAQRPVRIGADPSGNYAFTGFVDDVRITKGIGRYSGTTFFTPTSALTGDTSTVLLLHFNGANLSTTILDDGVTLQDLQTSAGGSADRINFANYQDFGAEFRSIGSACIYGVYGAYGDGDGCLAYLISQNFAYVGSGKSLANDPNERIAANEVVKLNRAKIYYTSVDNEGNFKVGDSFYVNQKTGDVLFSGENLSITTLAGITFSDGVHTTTITPSEVTTGNITISGNTIQSNVGDINVLANSGFINLQNNSYVTGDLTVTGNTIVNGNTTLGNASTDTVNFVASIGSSLIPSTNNFYDLGSASASLRWKNIYVNSANLNGINISTNNVQGTGTNTDLRFTANGTGKIYIPSNDVQVDQNLTVNNNFTVTTGTSYLKNTSITGTITQVGDINQTGNFVTSGNTQVTGNITGTGYLQLPVIRVENNTISTTTTNTDLELQANGTGNVIFEGIKISDNNILSTVTNSDIVLTPQGTGIVNINSNQSFKIPVGTTLERPSSPSVGMIRYNTTLAQYEGWTGSYWQTLGGVTDIAGATKITPELTPGTADNIIRFYINNVVKATLDSTKLTTPRIQTNNIDIQNDTITTTVSGTDLNLLTTGAGGVRVGNLRFRNNTITNVTSGGVTEFIQTAGGYVRIAGGGGVVIPSGDSLNDRPGIVETGMIRFNTVLGLVEVYNGVTWTSVAGQSGGVTAAEATDIGIVTALLFG
jgi:hypothetical protein